MLLTISECYRQFATDRRPQALHWRALSLKPHSSRTAKVGSARETEKDTPLAGLTVTGANRKDHI